MRVNRSQRKQSPVCEGLWDYLCIVHVSDRRRRREALRRWCSPGGGDATQTALVILLSGPVWGTKLRPIYQLVQCDEPLSWGWCHDFIFHHFTMLWIKFDENVKQPDIWVQIESITLPADSGLWPPPTIPLCQSLTSSTGLPAGVLMGRQTLSSLCSCSTNST